MKISSASKKVLASALSAAMVVAFAPTVAFGKPVTAGVAAGSEVDGTTYVASVTKGSNGDTYKYITLHDAVADAVAGDTINLLQDIYLADAASDSVSVASSVKGYYTTSGKCGDDDVAQAGVTYYEIVGGSITGSSCDPKKMYAGPDAKVVDGATAKTNNPTGSYYEVKVVTGLSTGGISSAVVSKTTAAKYENMKTGYTAVASYATAASVNGNGHKIVIENVATEANGTEAVPNIDGTGTILTVTNTTRATVKDLAIEDETDGDAKASGKQTTIGGVATAILDDQAAPVPAATATGTDVAGLTVTGLTVSNIVAKGSVDVAATADTLATGTETGVPATAVKVTGGSFKTVEGHAANALTVAGGTISGKVAALAKAPAGTKAATAKLAKPAATGAAVVVESWADESKRTFYQDTYTAAVYQAVITGGTIDGYVSGSTIKGGSFKLDPTEVLVAGGTTKSNAVAANYVYANGTVDKGIQASQIAGLAAFNVKTDSDASYNTVTGVKTEAVTATADTNKAIVSAATAAVKGLATTDKLYKAMYVTGGGAAATITIAKANSTAYVSADRVAALTEDQKAANAIVEGALATSGAANMAGVIGITVDAKTGKITNAATVEKVSATITAGAANTVKNGAVELADFGAVYSSIDLGAVDPEYTGMALLFSADGKTWSVAQSGMKVYKSTGANGQTANNYYVDAAYGKAGYYALAYTNAANDAKVKAEEEAKKAAEEAAAKLIATQDASAAKDVKGVNKTYKSKNGKLAATKTFKLKAVTSESGAKATYKKANTAGKSKITVSKAGKVTLKKGLKKGKYSLKVKGTVGASSKTVTCKIVIK